MDNAHVKHLAAAQGGNAQKEAFAQTKDNSYQQIWRTRNREHVNARARAWYAANKDRVKQKREERFANDPGYREKLRAYAREYYTANRERLNAYMRGWYARRKLATRSALNNAPGIETDAPAGDDKSQKKSGHYLSPCEKLMALFKNLFR